MSSDLPLMYNHNMGNVDVQALLQICWPLIMRRLESLIYEKKRNFHACNAITLSLRVFLPLLLRAGSPSYTNNFHSVDINTMSTLYISVNFSPRQIQERKGITIIPRRPVDRLKSIGKHRLMQTIEQSDNANHGTKVRYITVLCFSSISGWNTDVQVGRRVSKNGNIEIGQNKRDSLTYNTSNIFMTGDL